MEETDIVICRCEDVTEAQVLEAIRGGQQSLDELKRLLRCGMGHCQGRTCGRLIAGLLCRELGKKMDQLPWTTYRSPLLPVTLEVLAAARLSRQGC
jgi:NAD(P)H-nitrite reductase large subunit